MPGEVHPTERHTTHEVTVAAPATTLYDLVADVGRWPAIFPPTVFAEQVEGLDDGERIRIWATANGEVKGWTSRRRLDRRRLSIAFQQEVSAAPVAAMRGEWRFEEAGAGRTTVRLLHSFRAVDDDPAHLDWIGRAVEHNSAAELAALSAAALRDPDLVLSFEDSVPIDGPADEAYAFIYDAKQWPQRLPHVAAVDLDERTVNVQRLGMDTRTTDGATHTTTSIRICLPPDRIVYKQLRTPRLMSVHVGHWRFADRDGGTELTAGHTVVIDPTAVTAVLGPDATVAHARAYIRDALGRNSGTTMRYAKAYAEQARRS
jgi:aromatase